MPQSRHMWSESERDYLKKLIGSLGTSRKARNSTIAIFLEKYPNRTFRAIATMRTYMINSMRGLNRKPKKILEIPNTNGCSPRKIKGVSERKPCSDKTIDINRHFDCRQYDTALLIATSQKWNNFTCKFCSKYVLPEKRKSNIEDFISCKNVVETIFNISPEWTE